MQANFSSSRILLPVRPWFIYFSLFLALLLNLLPDATWLWMPDWLALVLVFWGIRESRYVGMGTAFIVGLLMDVADSAVLGQHALAYVLAAYAALYLSRRILWFQMAQQALHVLPIILTVQLAQALMRVFVGAPMPGLAYFASAFLATMLWPLLSFVLLLPQYQPVVRDENRPI